MSVSFCYSRSSTKKISFTNALAHVVIVARLQRMIWNLVVGI